MTLLPSESFVPLTAAPPGQDHEFKVAVIPAQASKAAFQSLEQLRTEPAPGASAPAGAKKPVCEPRVSVQRDGDRIASIRVQCSCGQVMDIACVYDPVIRQV